MPFINKKIFGLGLLFTGCLASTAHAVAPGFYLGLMLGPAANTGGTQQAYVESVTPPPGATTTESCRQNPANCTPVTPRSKQFGSRLFLGNQINRYAGIEGGFTYFSTINYDTKGVETFAKPFVTVRTLDLVGKGILPLGEFFDFFVKAGVAGTYVTESGAFYPPKLKLPKPTKKNPNPTAVLTSDSQSKFKFAPTASLGASFTINQSWVVDASWTRIMVGGMPRNVDFYAIGISYHFVDRYCGQFLCDD